MRQITIKLEEELYLELKEKSKEERRSVANFVRGLIEQAVSSQNLRILSEQK